jgi:sulfite reductase alpha subunit-like flavoprotein
LLMAHCVFEVAGDQGDMSVGHRLCEAAETHEVPSRAVLGLAERRSKALGHELGGFLSTLAGFMPRLPTVQSFPSTHTAWDEVVQRMPELWRTVALRGALRELPLLSATCEDLPDEFVWRASVALGIFAHAYVRVEVLPGGDLPPSISVPWAQISERLGRREPHLSYNDLIVYNHRLRDPRLPRPHTVENMDLLVPSVDNREERRFYLAQVEILARSTPIVSAVVRAQEAAVRGDHDALRMELMLMLETWRDLTEISFRKVDPNPLSETYIDQVVWANTVAPLAVPIKPRTAGPGGEASPIFHLMDAFLGRKFKKSHLGKEVADLRGWFPAHQIAFLEAVERVSVRDHIAASGDRRLQSLFDTLFDAYAGRKGYLGTHRLKVYGFLELAFKVGRSVTITGISGGFKDRHWNTLDAILEETRLERFKELPPHAQYARVRSRQATAAEGGVTRVVLDTSETGVIYRPGDRCGVLSMNRPDVVDATLLAFGATGDEPIPLNAAWREAVRYRMEHPPGTDSLQLRMFLTYAKLRPLKRPTAKALLAVSGSAGLHDVLEGYHEEHWELSDALDLLRREGYDVRRLLDADLGHQEALAKVVSPETFRMYSVSSSPTGGPDQAAEEFHLTVAQLRYEADQRGPRDEGSELVGTASTYLTETTDGEHRPHAFPIQMVRPSRFGLPRDHSRPVVMFAGGVGIAPFLGFLTERRRQRSTGDNWLFFGTRSRRHLYAEPELTESVEDGKLALCVAFSREDGGLRAALGEPLRAVPGPPQRIDEAINCDPDIQRTLWDLLRSERNGGMGAFFYVCGRAGFARSIMTTLTGVAERFAAGAGGDGADLARGVMRRLVAEGRYMQDVYSSWTPHTDPGVLGARLLDTSEVALHTTPEAGQWMIVNGVVYDVTEFLHLHPGGPRIITENVGLDATAEYEAVLHHENSEINAMLAMYKIGSIRRLEFGDTWGIALVPGAGPSVISLHDLYRHWVRFLHLLTEMSNALANDWGYMTSAMTRGDDPETLNALKVQFASNTHRRFLSSYYEAALGEDLLYLWALTTGLCAPTDFRQNLGGAIELASRTPEATMVRRFSEEMRTAYQHVAGDPASIDDALWPRLRAMCALLERHDRSFLATMRSLVRDGVMVFEELEDRTIADGGDRLVAVLERIPGVVRTHNKAFVDDLNDIGWSPAAKR